MNSLAEQPKVDIKPEEDARLPILKAQIEREWTNSRPQYVKSLVRAGSLQSQIRETALQCVRVLHQYQNAGKNPDQGREAMQALIHPQLNQS